MTFKALALGAVLGFLFALPSCSPAPCGPANCHGCCDATIGKCRDPGNTTGSCGAEGLTCQACAAGESCTAGLCKGGVGGGAGGASGGGAGGGGVAGGAGGGGGGNAGPPAGCGPGTSQPCATGCCNGSGATATCLPGTAGSACGKNASACAACNFASGQNCVAQACFGFNDAGPDIYGDPCTADSDCAGLGGNFKCKLATTADNASYPGGYCTRLCTVASDCPAAFSTCLAVSAIYGEGDRFCWNRCSGTDPCRPGYLCYTVGGPSGCWLNPLPTLDAGPVSNKTGLACTVKADCTNPPDDGFCKAEFLADGGPTGLPGGSCSAFCRIDKNHCGDGGVCLITDAGTRVCEMTCAAPLQGQGLCRTGYVCGPIRLADAGSAAAGRCEGSCNNPGSACPTGFTCAAEDAGVAVAGYCCDSLGCL